MTTSTDASMFSQPQPTTTTTKKRTSKGFHTSDKTLKKEELERVKKTRVDDQDQEVLNFSLVVLGAQEDPKEIDHSIADVERLMFCRRYVRVAIPVTAKLDFVPLFENLPTKVTTDWIQQESQFTSGLLHFNFHVLTVGANRKNKGCRPLMKVELPTSRGNRSENRSDKPIFYDRNNEMTFSEFKSAFQHELSRKHIYIQIAAIPGETLCSSPRYDN